MTRESVSDESADDSLLDKQRQTFRRLHSTITDGGDEGCCGTETTDDPTGIETEQSCCGTETTNDSTEIETDQSCCGTETKSNPTGIETEQSCCGTETTNDSTGIETEQSCCGDEPTTQQESSCCGESSTEQSSCCGDSGDGDELEGGGRKSPAERERIREAAEHTEALLAEMADAWKPDWTEIDVSEFLQDRLDQSSYGAAWSRDHCPTVDAGRDAEIGHTPPTDRTLPAGELLHVDFGVTYEGYASDIQRVYYYPDGEESVPDDLRTVFEDVRAAIDAGREALEPGVRGHEVDAAAREELTDRGWSEFNHAFGHQVGQDAHDGGTLLGPLWDRYGDRPRGEVQADEIYSIELGVGTTYGYVAQEEMVRVTEDGHEFVVEPQTDLRPLSG